MPESNDEIILIDIYRRGMVYFLVFSNEVEIRTTKGVIGSYNFTKGMSFTPYQWREVKELLDKKFAWYTAETFLARRAYSIGQFRRKMREKEISEALLNDIVGRFKDLKLLDDCRFAANRAESILRRKPAGRGFLIADLQKRMIPRDVAEKIVGEILADKDETVLAVELLEKKRSAYEKFDLETARRKAYNYLSRRAISYGAAREAFERVFESDEP